MDDLAAELTAAASQLEAEFSAVLAGICREAAAALKAAEAAIVDIRNTYDEALTLARDDAEKAEEHIAVLEIQMATVIISAEEHKARAEKAEADLAAAKANSELFERENEQFRRQVIDLQNQMMKERGYLAAARSENDRLREGLRPLLTTTKLLLENSRLCAVKHHGFKEETDPAPSWLIDARKAVDAAAALFAGKKTSGNAIRKAKP